MSTRGGGLGNCTSGPTGVREVTRTLTRTGSDPSTRGSYLDGLHGFSTGWRVYHKLGGAYGRLPIVVSTRKLRVVHRRNG